MYCASCGHYIIENTNTCPACGAQQQQAPQMQQGGQGAVPPAEGYAAPVSQDSYNEQTSPASYTAYAPQDDMQSGVNSTDYGSVYPAMNEHPQQGYAPAPYQGAGGTASQYEGHNHTKQPQGYTPAPTEYMAPPQGYAPAQQYGAPHPMNNLSPQGYAPPKKKRTGLIIGLVSGGLALILAAGIVLWVFVLGKGTGVDTSMPFGGASGHSPQYEPPNGGASQSAPAIGGSSEAPAASSGAPSSSQPQQVETSGDGYTWMVEPVLQYDSLQPIPDYIGDESMAHYIAFYEHGMQGIAYFEPEVGLSGDEFGEIVIEPYDGMLFRYDCGMLHGLPPEIEVATSDGQNSWLEERGFPFGTDGGHGGFSEQLFGIDENGTLVPGFISYGEFSTVDDDIFEEYFPQIMPVFDMAVLDSTGMMPDDGILYGLATKDGEMLLDIEYTQIYAAAGGMITLQQGDKFGYYSPEQRAIIAQTEYDTVWGESYPRGGAGTFVYGYTTIVQDGKYGFMHESGEVVVEPMFDNASHVFGGRAWVQQDGKWGLIVLE